MLDMGTMKEICIEECIFGDVDVCQEEDSRGMYRDGISEVVVDLFGPRKLLRLGQL